MGLNATIETASGHRRWSAAVYCECAECERRGLACSHRLVQCRQEIGSAAMISEAVVGVARFTPVAPVRGLTVLRPASRPLPSR